MHVFTTLNVACSSDTSLVETRMFKPLSEFNITDFDSPVVRPEDDKSDWLVVYVEGKSSLLDQANWDVFRQELEKFPGQYEVMSTRHWTVRQINFIAVRPDSEALDKATELVKALQEYPILDEAYYDSLREDAYVENLKDVVTDFERFFDSVYDDLFEYAEELEDKDLSDRLTDSLIEAREKTVLRFKGNDGIAFVRELYEEFVDPYENDYPEVLFNKFENLVDHWEHPQTLPAFLKGEPLIVRRDFGFLERFGNLNLEPLSKIYEAEGQQRLRL